MLPEVSTKEEAEAERAGKVVPGIHFLRGLTPRDDLATALSDHLRGRQVVRYTGRLHC